MKFSVTKNSIYIIKYFFKASPVNTLLYIFSEICKTLYYVLFIVLFTQTIFNRMEQGIQFNYFIGLLMGYLIIALFFYLFSAVTENYIVPVMYCKTRNYIAEVLYTKATSYDIKYYENSDFYNKFTIAASETFDKASETLDLVCDLLGKLISIMLLAGYIIRDNFIIYLTIVIPVIVVYYINKKINTIQYNKYKNEVPIRRKLEYINKAFHLKDFSQEIKMTGISGILFNKFSELRDELLLSIKLYGTKLGVLYGLWNVSFNTLPVIVVYLTSIYLFAVAKTLSLGAFISFATAATVIQSNLSSLVQLYSSFAKNSLYINDIREFNSFTPEICDLPESVALNCENPTIEFENVSFKYPNTEQYILQNINLTLNFGEKIALIGLNGAGKSTLIKLLLRLYDPTEGDIKINGVNIKKYSVSSYRKIFSVMFQDYNIYAMSVYDNISVGSETDDQELVSQSLERASIKEKINSFSDSENTILSKEFDSNGEILSGGEMQKIALARFFSKQNKIAVADEPTSALDPFATNNVFNEIINYVENKTLIYITHTLSHVVDFDKIYVLDNGKINEEGTHQDLMQHNGLYSKMFSAQSENFKI